VATLWFCLLALMIAMYVVFDGFDLGVGVVHLFTARTDEDRRRAVAAIGPFWDGNEVWLLATGGVLYFAFPAVYARSFSGFYLPLMLVLWLLILRALALELRGAVAHPLWTALWDRCFGLASLLLAVFFGAALGNVVRGVPLGRDGRFFEPLWTHFRTSGATGVLDWYTLLAGGTAAVALAVHGALWLAVRTEGEPHDRARRLALRLWAPLGVVVALLTWATIEVQPQVSAQLVGRPWGFAFPALAVAGFLGIRRFARRGRPARAFLASCLLLAGLVASAAFGIYPYLLPSNGGAGPGLSVHDTAAPRYGLGVGLAWWSVGMALVAVYFAVLYRRFGGKVRLEDAAHY